MMNRFRLAPRAETDIAEICSYIARDNPAAANSFSDKLFDLFQAIARNPEIGQLRVDLRPNLRSISHGNYVVFFYPGKSGAEIVGVIHGARDIDRLFLENDR